MTACMVYLGGSFEAWIHIAWASHSEELLGYLLNKYRSSFSELSLLLRLPISIILILNGNIS